MDLRHNTRVLLLAIIAVAVSGAAFYASQGLDPRWWAIWWAPLPILCIATRLSWLGATFASFAAGVIGALSMWEYHGRLQLPLWLKLATLILPAVAFCLSVLGFRMLLMRKRAALAVLVVPSLMVAYEYLVSLMFGTFGATAYTQLKNLPIIQLGALTGLWGISFAVLLFSPMLAGILLSNGRPRRRIVGAFAITYTLLFGYGALRLHDTPPPQHSAVFGLIVSDLPQNTFPQKDEDALQLMRDYAEQVKPLAERGAKVVVMPEMTALVHDSVLNDIDKLFESTARSENVQILVGVLHVTSNAAFNEARLYSESGTLPVVYRKRHLVPVVEGGTTPINDFVVVRQPLGRIGLEICRDMDYPDPAIQYGKAGIGLLLVPAWDFDIDRLWHGHMAIMRGVENGFTLVRAAKQGLLTVSDDRGRVLAETETSPQQPFTSMVAVVPVRHDWTLYQSWGDWFAWLSLAMTGGILAVIAKRSHSRVVRCEAAAALR